MGAEENDLPWMDLDVEWMYGCS